MGAKTKIDWCDSTWNPVTGCLHGCEYCYARRIAERFRAREIYDPECQCQRKLIERGMLKGTGKPLELTYPWEQKNKDGSITNAAYPFGFDPTFHRYKLDEPQRWKKPRTIFVCSMADLFGDWVPDEWIQEIFEACDKASQHRYMFLTKNPSRYAELLNLLPKHRRPPNVAEMWFGQSFTGAERNYTPLALPPWQYRFASIEPLLRNLSRAEAMKIAATNEWIIVGAETGVRKGKIIPKREWVEEIVKVCKEYGTPVFMKDSLRDLMRDGFRQEFPWIVGGSELF
jgi:protein gp37